jgi:succinate dehydrogenase/fumarate reductase-like Fe-S protein
VTERVVELRGEEAHQAVQAARARRTRTAPGHAAGRRRPRQEFRKCIECFLCQDVCHVLRDHHKHDEFIGPRFRLHRGSSRCTRWIPRTARRAAEARVGYCNITKCCTKVCPEHITITDNAIIPLKERVAEQGALALQPAGLGVSGLRVVAAGDGAV